MRTEQASTRQIENNRAEERMLQENQQRLDRSMGELRERLEEEDETSTIAPLITSGRQTRYVLWSFMYMEGLAGRLPELSEGAEKWFWRRATRKTPSRRDRLQAGLVHTVTGHTVDHVSFGGFRNQIWAVLHQ